MVWIMGPIGLTFVLTHWVPRGGKETSEFRISRAHARFPRYLIKLPSQRAVVVVRWSALSPTAPKIPVRIPQATKYLLYEKTKINEKEARVGPLKKVTQPSLLGLALLFVQLYLDSR